MNNLEYIQCVNDEQMIDAVARFGGEAWVTSDKRVYRSIELWNRFSIYGADAVTFQSLLDLQHTLEELNDSMVEMNFNDIVMRAKELEATFKKAMKAIKYKPLVRRVF